MLNLKDFDGRGQFLDFFISLRRRALYKKMKYPTLKRLNIWNFLYKLIVLSFTIFKSEVNLRINLLTIQPPIIRASFKRYLPQSAHINRIIAFTLGINFIKLKHNL